MRLEDARRRLMEINFQKRTAHVEKPHMFRQLRKEIACIHTVLHEKQRETHNETNAD